MKKWYEWQLKNQVKNKNWVDIVTPVVNLSKELEWFTSFVIDGHKNKTLDCYFDNVFFRSDWTAKASDSTNGEVSESELYNWMHDSEFETLMSRQGVEYIVNFDQETDIKLRKLLSDCLNLDESSINFRIHIQRPGEFFALHFDRNKYGQFEIDDPKNNYETRSKIFLIFLNDRRLGQSFHLGPAQLDWKEGDVFTWEQSDIPHGSANVGLDNRYSIIITGYKKYD